MKAGKTQNLIYVAMQVTEWKTQECDRQAGKKKKQQKKPKKQDAIILNLWNCMIGRKKDVYSQCHRII